MADKQDQQVAEAPRDDFVNDGSEVSDVDDEITNGENWEGDSYTQAVCDPLRENRLESFRFKSHEYSELVVQDYRLIREALLGNKSVTELILGAPDDDDDDDDDDDGWGRNETAVVQEFIQTSPCLKRLVLGDAIPASDCKQLFQAVKRNPNVESIGCFLKASTVETMVVDLSGCTQALKHLELKESRGSDEPQLETIGSLANAIKDNNSLESVTLKNVEQLAAFLFAALPENHPMEAIYLAYDVASNSSRSCCRNLRDLLQRTRSIKTLILDENAGFSFSQGHWKTIVHGLCQNDTVCALQLQGIVMDEEGSQLLQYFIRFATNILDLFLCHLRTVVDDTDSFWNDISRAVVANGSIKSIGLSGEVPPESILTMMQQCEKFTVLFYAQNNIFPAIGDAIVNSYLKDLSLLYYENAEPSPQTENGCIRNLKPLTEALPKSPSLRRLQLKHGFGAKHIADHLSSKSCSLTHLELGLFPGDVNEIIAALWTNETLKSLILSEEYDAYATEDRSWLPQLVASLVENTSLTHVEIQGLCLEWEMGGIVSFLCLRNKYLPAIVGLQSRLLPYIAQWLLRHRLGASVWYWFMIDMYASDPEAFNTDADVNFLQVLGRYTEANCMP